MKQKVERMRKQPSKWKLGQAALRKINRELQPFINKMQRGKKLSREERKKYDELSKKMIKIYKWSEVI